MVLNFNATFSMFIFKALLQNYSLVIFENCLGGIVCTGSVL